MDTRVDLIAVGERLRGVREERALTLEQLAGLTGLTKAHLSRLESGERQASIGALVSLAHALGTRVSTLLGEDMNASPLSTYPVDAARHSANGLQIASCSGFSDSHVLEAMRVLIPAHRDPSPPVRHAGEEWLYVQKGAIELEYDGVLYELTKDSATHFDATRPHRMTARRTSAEVLLVSAEDRSDLRRIRH